MEKKVIPPILFQDRKDAGQKLAQLLMPFFQAENTIVLGMVRGGLVVAFEVAQALNIPFDSIICRKIGAPHNRELGVGALAPDGTPYFNAYVMARQHLQPKDLQAIITEEYKELKRREKLYHHDRESLNLDNKTVILIDDGIATGSSVQAVIPYLRKKKAHKIIIGTPICAAKAHALLEPLVDAIIAVTVETSFHDIADFYETFGDVSDEVVIHLLSHA